MNKFIKGITYSYYRNIGWQDRTIRTTVGILAVVGAIYFFKTNASVSIVLVVFAIAQFGTVLSARCIMCYFAGKCTIDSKEKKALQAKAIPYENPKN
ncbi:YgaP family membrane protein [Aquimarina celericrescens]|uniref:DUF2892 domain-containing protein n=1 Tax=Aquimarina celericrescens TaxID=1964542 RepID=A0ABW5AYZ5_9FLAO|nr:hypothetical protein [Aquimarina celericrescens]